MTSCVPAGPSESRAWRGGSPQVAEAARRSAHGWYVYVTASEGALYAAGNTLDEYRAWKYYYSQH